jgi:hypothetical protein
VSYIRNPWSGRIGLEHKAVVRSRSPGADSYPVGVLPIHLKVKGAVSVECEPSALEEKEAAEISPTIAVVELAAPIRRSGVQRIARWHASAEQGKQGQKKGTCCRAITQSSHRLQSIQRSGVQRRAEEGAEADRRRANRCSATLGVLGDALRITAQKLLVRHESQHTAPQTERERG